MSTPTGEAAITALALDAGVSHETARHALICGLFHRRVVAKHMLRGGTT